MRAALLSLAVLGACDVAAGLSGYAFSDGGAAPTSSDGGQGGIGGTATGNEGGEGGLGGAGLGGEGGTGGNAGGAGGEGGVVRPGCGNGILEPATEECDDGNTDNGDGCNAICLVTCEGGFKRPLTNHCYWLMTDNKSFNEAVVACEAMGNAHLATVLDASERDYIDDTIDPNDKYWLGGQDFAMEGTFVWITGEAFPADLWDNGEPNNGGAIGGEQDCVAGYASDGSFDDENCDENRDYLCEREPPGK